jgi:ribose-phosphate pyrophosphokinase
MGDVKGRVCVLVDDQISTAGTICAAADQLMAHGASEVHVVATHGIFADPALDRIKNSSISRVVVTDTVPLADDQHLDKIEVLSVAGIIGDALTAVFEDTSVSEIFGGENQA